MRNENGRPALSREPARDETRDQQSLQEPTPPKSTRAEREAAGFRKARRLVQEARLAARWRYRTATSDDEAREAIATMAALSSAATYLHGREKKLCVEAWR